MSATVQQLSLFDTSEFKLNRVPDLQSALDCLNSIPHINHGGCGLSALAIYRWCKKNGVEVSDRPFVVLCEDEWELDHNNTACENGDVLEICIPHITIELDGQLWDSTGNEDDHEDESCFEWLTLRQDYKLNEEELVALCNTDSWNSLFNRDKYRDIIAYGLDIDLSDVKLF
jgi:hypothetical protein